MTSLSILFSALLSLLNTWLGGWTEAVAPPPGHRHLSAYQDLKPKDILDNNNSSTARSPKVRPYSAMDGVPFFLSRVKPEPPEDLLAHDLHFHTQTEPVDLSINKPRPSSSSAIPTSTTTSSSSPLRSAFSPSSLSSPSSSSSSSSSPSVITSASSVLTPGPLVAPGAGVRGQPYLHILHSVPPPPSSPLSLQGAGKLSSHVHRIPVVVQSLPLMYTTAVRSPSSLNNAIMLPLLDEVKSQGKGETMLSKLNPYSYI
ncbi:Krueppel-like factor 12 [Lates japonicus]|uniref:Krueppel-like factor 12 n=1 Tax=Lates japonicus TaxID=270547 RepID=A0AAD3MD22_LATJO|nr:Krueppel-like factor 12 [Lates japonicus]